MLKLSEHKAFFQDAAKIAFANPFSDETLNLELELTGLKRGTKRHEIRAELSHILRAKIQTLEKKNGADVKKYRGEDNDILNLCLLYDILLQSIPCLDEYIVRQSKSDEALVFKEGPRILQQLLHAGYNQEEANKLLAMIYQFRRGYFFVEKGLIGESSSMQELRRRIWQNLFTSDIRWYVNHLWNHMEDYALLILGETGTGKGATSSAIGKSGFISYNAKANRFNKSFTQCYHPVNLSQFPESLIESELFGHHKGAFTGAIKDYDGAISECKQFGTLFLDEIGEVSIPVQIKLLNLLQERSYSPVGSHEQLHFPGRVIAATNQSIQQLRAEGKFRDDFFYRLSADIIEVPSLRQRIKERPAELKDMVVHLLPRIAGESNKQLQNEILEILDRQLPKNYTWPGNVRELEQAMRRILIAKEYKGDVNTSPQAANPALTIEEQCRQLYQQDPNFSSVARKLGLDRRTVKKHLLDPAGKAS